MSAHPMLSAWQVPVCGAGARPSFPAGGCISKSVASVSSIQQQLPQMAVGSMFLRCVGAQAGMVGSISPICSSHDILRFGQHARRWITAP